MYIVYAHMYKVVIKVMYKNTVVLFFSGHGASYKRGQTWQDYTCLVEG